MIGVDGRMGMLNVTGKPFSGTESTRSVQILGNSAHIENSNSNLFYRDDQGRTRAEETVDGKTIVVIMDPVAKFVTILDPTAKTARRTSIPDKASQGAVWVTNGAVEMQWRATSGNAQAGPPPKVEVRLSGDKIEGIRRSTEDLGMQTVNGVLAQGTRNTVVIPAGNIGNDRDLQVVDERWFSADLQTLVKSVNSDPRFGDTTYQLTNIVRGAQDPSLFQVPADYTVTEGMRLNMHISSPAK